MMKLILPLLVFAFFAGCTEPIVREAPPVFNQTVSLGFFSFSDATISFTPYYEKRTLIFMDESGVEYTFRMSQPILQEKYSYIRTFPHPEEMGRFVDYRYAGNHAIFDFISTELGARLSVVLQPDFCEDPRLNSEMLPHDYLQIRGVGFNDGDIALSAPTLAVETQFNRPCGGGRKLGNIELGGKTFTNVTYQRQPLGDRFFEVYYSPEDGVVAIGTTYMFLVLKEAY